MKIHWRWLLILSTLAGLWWLLAGGEPASWVIGAPAVLAAGWAMRRLRERSPGTVSVTGLVRFIPFFLWESLCGGVDVARRILAPRMRIQPGFSKFRTELRQQDARVFLVTCVSLLPGTLAADLQGDGLSLHVLDMESDPEPELRRLERSVARVFPQSPDRRSRLS